MSSTSLLLHLLSPCPYPTYSSDLLPTELAWLEANFQHAGGSDQARAYHALVPSAPTLARPAHAAVLKLDRGAARAFNERFNYAERFGEALDVRDLAVEWILAGENGGRRRGEQRVAVASDEGVEWQAVWV
jgi:hypothetical protein